MRTRYSISISSVICVIIASNCSESLDDNNADIVKYEMTAVVDQEDIIPNEYFNASHGDTLHGTFCYSLNSQDNNDLDSNQGWYYKLPEPANIAFSLDSLQYRSTDLTIGIQNHASSLISPDGHVFELTADDTVASRRFNTDYVSVILALKDTTSNSFYSDSLPQNLQLENYSFHYIFVNFMKADTTYGIRLKILELSRMK